MDDVLAEELEALKCIYNEDELTVVHTSPLELALQIDPTTSSGGMRYVHACLVLTAGTQYPEQAAQCRLQDVKGLGDQRRAALQVRLEEEAAEMRGECMLGHLCSLAQETMTDMNCPEGFCAFCLEEMKEDYSPKDLLVLSCYHCFHRSCFARWYLAVQRAKRKEREQTIQAHTHAATPEFLKKAGLATLEHDLFAVACPVCRTTISPAEFTASDLQHFVILRGSELEDDKGVRLTREALDSLRRMQSRHKTLYEQQVARGGIVSEKYAVGLH